MDEEYGAIVGIFSLIISIVVIILVIVFGGVYRTDVTISVDDITSDNLGKVSFEKKYTAGHWLAGIKKGKPVDTKSAMSEYSSKDYKLSSMKVSFRHSFSNILVTIVTLGIYCPVTVVVSGDLIRTAPSN